MSGRHVGLSLVAGIALALSMAGAASGAYIPPPGKYLSVDVGEDHVCAIRSDRRVRCWGVNLDGEAEPPAGRFVAVGAGGGHSCGIRADATLACWGRHDFGRSLPSGSFTAIGAGGLTCALGTAGTVTCLGLGPFDTEPTGTYTSISAGARHACGVSSDTTLACWGDNGWHQSDVPSGSFSAVSAGLVHTCGIRSDASLACWGGEDYFELETLGTPPAGSFRAVSAGDTHSCAIRTDATIACWGEEAFDATTPPRGRFRSVSAGHVNTCAIRTNARLVCWGRDYGGAPLEATDAFSLPSCVSGRTLTFRINRVPSFTFMRVVVKVRGKRVKTVKGVGVRGPVRLTRLPKGRFKLSVTVFAIGKPPVTAHRMYRRCA